MEQVELAQCRVDTISLAEAAFALNQTLCAVTHPIWETHPCAGDRDGLAFDSLEFYNAASPSTDYSQTWSPWDSDVAFSERAEQITFSRENYCGVENFSGDQFLKTRAQNYMCENTNERLAESYQWQCEEVEIMIDYQIHQWDPIATIC